MPSANEKIRSVFSVVFFGVESGWRSLSLLMDVLTLAEAVLVLKRGQKRLVLGPLTDQEAALLCVAVSEHSALDVEFRDLSRTAIRTVVAGCAKSLKRVAFSNCDVGDESFAELISSPTASLSISSCVSPWTGVQSFIQLLRGSSSLVELSLARTHTSGLGALGLWEALGKSSVQRLSLGDRSIEPADLAPISLVDIVGLRALALNVPIGKSGVVSLVQALHCQRMMDLEEIELKACAFESGGQSNHILALVQALGNQRKLRSVDVSFNTVSREEAASIAELAGTSSIKRLKMQGMVLSGAAVIDTLFQRAVRLEQLSCVVDQLGLHQAKILAKSVRDSTVLQELRVELILARRNLLEKDEIYALLADAVEANTSGLDECEFKIENWAMAHEETDKNALRIREICRARKERKRKEAAEREAKEEEARIAALAQSKQKGTSLSLAVFGLVAVASVAGGVWWFASQQKDQ